MSGGGAEGMEPRVGSNLSMFSLGVEGAVKPLMLLVNYDRTLADAVALGLIQNFFRFA